MSRRRKGHYPYLLTFHCCNSFHYLPLTYNSQSRSVQFFFAPARILNFRFGKNQSLVFTYVSDQTRDLPVLEMAFPFPVMTPISSTVLFWISLLKNFHLVRSPNWQPAITGTGCDSFRTISSTGPCHFRYGNSLCPVPEVDSMCVVPFPVPGSAISGMVIHCAPYRK